MTLQPSKQFLDYEARNRIFYLQELIRANTIRIGSLETSVLRWHRKAEEFDRTKQQIASFDTAIVQQKGENVIRVREHREFLSNFTSLEKSQEELKQQLMQHPPSFPLNSIESDVLQLKTTLIEKSILPERSFSVNEDRFDGIIADLTRNCGGNVSDRGIAEIKASSFFDDTYLPKNAANFTLSSPIFNSKNEMNQ
jgi:hypothetical protein